MNTSQAHPAVKDWPDLLDRDDVLILDCETTGLSRRSECVEIGIIDTTGRKAFYSLILPKGRLPREASDVHGITRKKLLAARAPTYNKVHADIKATLRRASLVIAYNASFDKRLLRQTASLYRLSPPDVSWRCAMRNYAAYRDELDPSFGDPRRHKLIEAAWHERVDTSNIEAHTAIGDCRLTLGIMRAVSEKI